MFWHINFVCFGTLIEEKLSGLILGFEEERPRAYSYQKIISSPSYGLDIPT